MLKITFILKPFRLSIVIILPYIIKKVNYLSLIASICWFFWTLINVFELLTDVPFIISVCGTVFIFAAVVVHLVILIKSIKDKKK